MTPYTTKTGLKIGAFYQPPVQMPEPDRDACRLQRALFDEPTPVDWDGIAIVVFCALLAIIAVVAA